MVWLIIVEAGVQLWYHSRESKIQSGLAWSVVFPTNNASFKELPMAEKTRNLLRFDDGKLGAWKDDDGTEWQAFYFNWIPGRVAGYLAKRHTPEACMTGAGHQMLAGPELKRINIHGIELPMRCYLFKNGNKQWHVFQCRWETGVGNTNFVQDETTRFNLLRGVWAGRGNKGQKVIEVIITGIQDPDEAKAALIKQLEKMIKVGH